MRILGIDPGCVVTGYGIIEEAQGRIAHLDNGGIFPPAKAAFSDRICFIHDQIEVLIAKFSPEAVVIENIFVAKNVQSTLKLGHARGAAMVAASRAGRPIFEYTALQVKQAVTGYGHASKEQIQKMVQALLKLPGAAFTDASDALAVALCHANSYRMMRKVKAG
ncbi:MAG: crossover junction endodeoxyribonuclease RuvC [Deltaproteobacteria bacterium]|nr:crossover junction endodeoxyribonuclease RuvC [Deltaproteobacteria bacterium]